MLKQSVVILVVVHLLLPQDLKQIQLYYSAGISTIKTHITHAVEEDMDEVHQTQLLQFNVTCISEISSRPMPLETKYF